MTAEVLELQEWHPGLQHDTPLWLELLEHCGQFSECQPLIFNSMGRQLAAQQQQLAMQQQHIAERQVQLAATRAQAVAAAADQLGRMQALEAKVHQLLQALEQPQG